MPSSAATFSSSLPPPPAELEEYLRAKDGCCLRINKELSLLSYSNSHFIARFPSDLNLYDFPSPLCIHKDIVEVSSDIKTKKLSGLKYASDSLAKWRVKNAPKSDNNKKINYVGRKEEIDTNNFFILIQTEEGGQLFPVSSWFTFELDLDAKVKHAIDTDEAERHNRVAEAKEAAMNEKIRRRLAESDYRSDDERIKFDENKKSKNLYETSEAFAEDLGLKRQERKLMRNLMRNKNNDKTDEYVNSALAVTTLREHEVTWDFEEGDRSDDEGIANDLNDNLDGHDVLTHEMRQEDEGDGDIDEDVPNLTSYGQNVRNLLKKQEEKEQEDELNQYDSGDDEENAENSVDNSESQSNVVNNQTKSDRSQRTTGGVGAAVSATPSGSSGASQILSKEEMEQKVIRILTLNMGRLNVKDFMASFKVKDKNDEFKLLQATIQRLCCISTEEQNGQKNKYVNLKLEYRR